MIRRGGGYTKFGAWIRAAFTPGVSISDIYQSGGEWGFNVQNGQEITFNVGNYGEEGHYLTEHQPNFFEELKSGIDNLPAVVKYPSNIVYSIVDDAYMTAQFSKEATHLDGYGAWPKEIQNAGISTMTNFVPITKTGKIVGIGDEILSASQFSQLFKGTSTLKGSAKLRGLRNRAYNEAVETYNSFQNHFTWFSSILTGTTPALNNINNKDNKKSNNR